MKLTKQQAATIAALAAAVKGGRVRQTRTDAGLSLKSIGDAVGVVPATVLSWERGRVPRPAAALRYAAVLADIETAMRS